MYTHVIYHTTHRTLYIYIYIVGCRRAKQNARGGYSTIGSAAELGLQHDEPCLSWRLLTHPGGPQRNNHYFFLTMASEAP